MECENPKIMAFVLLAKISNGKIQQVALTDEDINAIIPIIAKDGVIKCVARDYSQVLSIGNGDGR